MRYADPFHRETPERIFRLLRDTIGEKLTASRLLTTFCSRRQQDKESLLDFSPALKELIDRAIQVDPVIVPDRDIALRDNFAEKVRNKDLRRVLRATIRREPETTFHDLREEAYQWMEEEVGHDVSGATHGIEADVGADQMPSKWKEIVDSQKKLIDLSERQQKAQDEILKELKESRQESMAKMQNYGNRYSQPRDKTFICFYCRKAGHK